MIELRSFNWAPSQHVTNYYKMKLSQIKGEMLGGTKELPQAPIAPAAAQRTFKPPSSHINANAPDFRLGTSHLLMNLPSRPTTSSLFSSSLNPHPTSPSINTQPPPLRQSNNKSSNQAMAMEDIKAGCGDNNSQNTTVSIH